MAALILLSLARWLSPVVGLGLIALGLLDMGMAVLHVERESPLSNQLARLLWRGLVASTKGAGERQRGQVLSWGLPLMIAGTIAFWAVMLVTGFALTYLPVVHTTTYVAIHERPGAPAVEDALYLSALSFLTLGFGDMVPVHPLVRALVVLEGASGLLTISLSVAYLVAVFPLVTRKIVLAAMLNQETGGRADGLLLARRVLLGDEQSLVGERLTWINAELMYLGQAHSRYPLLFYARPREVFESFVRVLALVQGIVALRYLLDEQAHAPLVKSVRLAILEEGLLYTLHSLEESVHLEVPGDMPDVPDHASAAADANAAADFDALRRVAVEYGLTPAGGLDAPDGAAALLAPYVRFRRATDPFIRAYAQSAAYEVAQVWAPFSREHRDAAPEPRTSPGAGQRSGVAASPEPEAPADSPAGSPAGSTTESAGEARRHGAAGTARPASGRQVGQ